MGYFRRNKFFYVFIFVLGGIVTIPSPALCAGNLKITRHNSFISYINLHPGLSKKNLVILRSAIGSGITLFNPDGGPSEHLDLAEGDTIAALTMPALFYPNPFRLEDGAVLGYRLNRGDMDISIRMYDMRGNQIFRKDITAGSTGAQYGYNKVLFNRSVLGHGNLPAGIYFYVIMHDGKVIGKGKAGVRP